VVNTISSESGLEGDNEIAQILNNTDIIIPASYDAKRSSDIIKKELIFTEASNERSKIGTLGASKEQVFEGLEKAMEIYKENDIILVIGEGGVKYAKKVLPEICL
jgi:UDP-N-acetylmuramate-alanine ligase